MNLRAFQNNKKFVFYNNYINENPILMNEVTNNIDVGYIKIYLSTNRFSDPIENAVITFYARQGNVNTVPVKQVNTTSNPTIVELPVAHPFGTLIKGPEYYYTTYNMIIEAEGYFSIIVLNIRMFPGITTEFDYNLNKALPGVPGRQETYSIPPHPRDII